MGILLAIHASNHY